MAHRHLRIFAYLTIASVGLRREPPSACDSSSGSESGDSLDSVATTAYPDARYGAATAGAAAAQPQAEQLPPRQASAACLQPVPRHQQDAQPMDACKTEAYGDLFTPSSFASRREPLAGNMRYRKIKDINRCAPLVARPTHNVTSI